MMGIMVHNNKTSPKAWYAEYCFVTDFKPGLRAHTYFTDSACKWGIKHFFKCTVRGK